MYACLVFQLELLLILLLFSSKVNICQIFHLEEVAVAISTDCLKHNQNNTNDNSDHKSLDKLRKYGKRFIEYFREVLVSLVSSSELPPILHCDLYLALDSSQPPT